MVSKRGREKIELELEEEMLNENPENQDWDIGLHKNDNFVVYVDRRIVCPWCKKARDLLIERGKLFTEIDVEEPGIKAFFRERRHKTVPQIYHNGRYVGGYSDLETYLGKK